MADPAAPQKPAKGARKEGAKKEKKQDDSGPLELNPPASFLQDRLELFDRLKAKQDQEIASKPRDPIKITMPDGSVKEGTAWETTPGDIAKGISNSLYKRTVVARLDGDNEKLWDLDRPFEGDCKLELLDFSDPEGKKVFWHSSAHVLGEACERRFGCSLCIGVSSHLCPAHGRVMARKFAEFKCHSHQLTPDFTTRWHYQTARPCKSLIGNRSRRLLAISPRRSKSSSA